jgi:hypothetical protein
MSRLVRGSAPTIDAAIGCNRTDANSIPKPFVALA